MSDTIIVNEAVPELSALEKIHTFSQLMRAEISNYILLRIKGESAEEELGKFKEACANFKKATAEFEEVEAVKEKWEEEGLEKIKEKAVELCEISLSLADAGKTGKSEREIFELKEKLR